MNKYSEFSKAKKTYHATMSPRNMLRQQKCVSKLVFDSEDQATNHNENHPHTNRVYKCGWCKKWHLTKKK